MTQVYIDQRYWEGRKNPTRILTYMSDITLQCKRSLSFVIHLSIGIIQCIFCFYLWYLSYLRNVTPDCAPCPLYNQERTITHQWLPRFFQWGRRHAPVMPALALILKLSVLLDIIYVLAQKGRFFGLLIESMQI